MNQNQTIEPRGVNPFDIICFFAIVIILLLAAFGCNTEKHITKERVIVDSTALKEKTDSIYYLKQENERLEAKVRELTYTQVLFDTVFLAGDTVVNTVIVKEDGTIEAAGKIKSLTISKQLLVNVIAEKNRMIDSLVKVKQKENVVVQKVTETKTRDVVKKVVPGYVWWLLILGIAGGIIIDRKIFLNK